MPCIWAKHDNRQIFIRVAIAPMEFGRDLGDRSDGPDAGFSEHVCNALLDTGAESTCITRQAARKIGLIPIGKTEVRGISGPDERNVYLFHVGFPMDQGARAGQGHGEGALYTLPVEIDGVEFESGSNRFDVLLGMDVIGTGSLSIEGCGTYSWSF